MQNSKKYVPPSKRVENNKFDVLYDSEEEPEVKPEQKYEDVFPSLVTNTVKPKQWEGKRKFSELAIQCELRSKEEKLREEIEKSMQNYSNNTYNNYLPKFDNVGRFVEPEDEEYVDETSNKENEEEGWTTVKHRKDRKIKSIEEIANRPPTPEEKSEWDQEVAEDSYWNEN